MNIFPYYLDLKAQNDLVNSCPVSESGLLNRRKVVGFAVGIAMAVTLPIKFGTMHEAESEFINSFRTPVEDFAAMINEFLIMDRTAALDIAKGYYMYRSAIANSQVLISSWTGLTTNIQSYISIADMDFYSKNSKEIEQLIRAFILMFDTHQKKRNENAISDLKSGY